MSQITGQLKPYALAILSLVVTAAAYLIGVLPPDGDLSDVTFVQWLGLVVFAGGSFGITQRARNQYPPQQR